LHLWALCPSVSSGLRAALAFGFFDFIYLFPICLPVEKGTERQKGSCHKKKWPEWKKPAIEDAEIEDAVPSLGSVDYTFWPSSISLLAFNAPPSGPPVSLIQPPLVPFVKQVKAPRPAVVRLRYFLIGRRCL